MHTTAKISLKFRKRQKERFHENANSWFQNWLLDMLNMLNQNIHTSDKDLDFKWLWSIQCKIMSTTSTNKSTNSPRLDSIRSSTKCKISALLLARTWWLTLMLSAWALAAELEIFEINSWNCNRVKFKIQISGYAFKPKINLFPDQKWPINQFDISYQNLQEGVKNDKYLNHHQIRRKTANLLLLQFLN